MTVGMEFALIVSLLLIVGTVRGVWLRDRRDPGWADRMDALRRTTERTGADGR